MRSLKGLRFAGVLMLMVFAASAAAWYLTVTSEWERYLTSRNFRLLSTIATQLDNSISGQQRTFATLLKTESRKGQAPDWFAAARDFVPSLQALDEERIPATLGPVASGSPLREVRKSHAVVDDRGAWLELEIGREAEGGPSRGNTRTVRLTLDGLLAPIFTPKLHDRAFDALLLASTEGRVLHAEGQLSGVLTLARLDQLEPVTRRFLTFGNAPQPSRAPGFSSVARTSGVIDVRISGTAYKLFTQPCCLATLTPASDGSQKAAGLVIVGLVDAGAFRSKARQFPPTVVMACVALILLAAASWPFLKLRLIGERQRIRRLDVVEVIACGMFGIALLAVVFVDVYAHQQLSNRRDAQLQSLAEAMSANVRSELNAAFDQLQALTAAILRCPPEPVATRVFDRAHLQQCNRGPLPQTYPHFKTMALLDPGGLQRVKWTSRDWQPEPIKVAGRAYYTEAKAGRYWQLPADDKPGGGARGSREYLLESIWSWTTTEPEAVLSQPTGRKDLPVATVTIPMLSLVDPVVAAGFEFAVIKDDGEVVFHSDPQRNTYENLFEETDQDRRLRASVTAHIHEHLNLWYGGRSYRAYVMRLGAGTPWSVVTLSSNEADWALHIEWLVLALAALAVHMLVLAALFGLCFFTGHADWLWTDPKQKTKYGALSWLMLVFLVIGGVIVCTGDNTVVLTTSFVLPFIAWLTGYVVLRLPPPVRRFPGDYVLLSVLLFLLTAVMPAAGYFTVAYRMQVRTDVKYTQLQLARDIVRRAKRLERVYQERPGVVSPLETNPIAGLNDLYYAFPYSTTVRRATDKDGQGPPPAVVDPGGVLQKVLEEYLPYYSERSVQMRELLLHEGATDQAWWWLRGPEPALVLKGESGQAPLLVSSSMPAFAQTILDASTIERVFWLVLPGLLLAALTWVVVRFIETHVCLRGVEQPLWSKARLAGNSGDNLFVVCDPSDREALSDGMFELRFESPVGEPIPDHELTRSLLELDRTDPGRPVLLADFNDRLDDPKLMRRKLDWTERLAADQARTLIVLSSAAPSLIAFPLKSQGGPAGALLLDRWRAVVRSFVVINWRAHNVALAQPDTFCWRQFWNALHPAPGVWRLDALRELIELRRDRAAREALRREGEADPFVHAVCASIEGRLPAPATGGPPAASGTRLSPDQVLDEITERTDAWYRRLWRACSPDEQLVLAEIASEGFVNYKSRRTVRRLLGRGLIAKDPSFRLMNATFRRFVLSASCQHDIHAIEGASDPSSWDRFRAPFYTVLTGASLFFLVTQQEIFNATIATLTTVTAAVPVLTRVLALVAGKRPDLEIPKV